MCKTCLQEKNLAEFYDHGPGKKRYDCISCWKDITRKQKERKDNDYLEKTRESSLKRNYDLTVAEYNVMLLNQNGLCLACEIHQSQLTRPLAVDHNHETGDVRGLLCTNCNSALGMVEENSRVLYGLISYLEQYNKKERSS